jgi:hypothetical protein
VGHGCEIQYEDTGWHVVYPSRYPVRVCTAESCSDYALLLQSGLHALLGSNPPAFLVAAKAPPPPISACTNPAWFVRGGTPTSLPLLRSVDVNDPKLALQ